MTAATRDLKTFALGTEDVPDPQLISLPMEANTFIYGGTIVCSNAAGNAIPAVPGGIIVWGRAELQLNNLSTNAPYGAARAQYINVRRGTFFFSQDGTISQANVGAKCYIVDDNTVSLSSSSGARVYAGIIQPGDQFLTVPITTTSKVAVRLGLAGAY